MHGGMRYRYTLVLGVLVLGFLLLWLATDTFLVQSPAVEAGKAYNSGVEHLEQKQFSRAIEYLDEAIRLDPNLGKAYIDRSYAYFKLGQYQRVIEGLTQAINIDPHLASAYINRGIAYQEIGKSEEAARDFARGKELGAP